ncbi:hypothetical protein DPMN_171986 [Dreissena polymorpha]|uniref:Uncharacterized protein n=1 Tax=Dreissena polymorpha TaxID=45954 RepID=A0A9D4DZ07_DREPO|nr:hypothetical protein DPMN_171986 [Dreissena polymorpha]
MYKNKHHFLISTRQRNQLKYRHDQFHNHNNHFLTSTHLCNQLVRTHKSNSHTLDNHCSSHHGRKDRHKMGPYTVGTLIRSGNRPKDSYSLSLIWRGTKGSEYKLV